MFSSVLYHYDSFLLFTGVWQVTHHVRTLLQLNILNPARLLKQPALCLKRDLLKH